MEDHERRKFLAQLGLTVGAMALGKDILNAFPKPDLIFQGKMQAKTVSPSSGTPEVDFRYAPADWQSTYCFPDDPFKSLVGKFGELLYGHAGMGADWNAFAHVVAVGLHDRARGTYVNQKLEAPGIPIITTDLEWDDVLMHLTSFATNDPDEGRIDNLLVELYSRGTNEVEVTPEITIHSEAGFTALSEGDHGTVQLNGNPPVIFFTVGSALQPGGDAHDHRFMLKGGKAAKDTAYKYLVRFPQEKQPKEKIRYDVGDVEKLLKEARDFWQLWSPTGGKVAWQINGVEQDFLTACSRNIVESREVKGGKHVYQVGPTCYRGLWMVDGYSLLEAARYLGQDKEAQESLDYMWNLQADDGSITGGAGATHYKDSAVAVFTLIRQAELTQNWDYFNELYPDAFKALMYLRDLRQNAKKDGTPNSKYGLMPEGFGDSGIGGSARPEFTNTIWTLVALKKMMEVIKRLKVPRLSDVVNFYGELREAFYKAGAEELVKHPKGFSYLPMLMRADTAWSDPDVKKRPKPQVAQIYLTQAVYPGMLFERGDRFAGGNLQLMQAVTTREDIPVETGWLSNDAVWPYNAAIVAQLYLYNLLPDLARKTFIGFLNHASPLFAWREEQSYAGTPNPQYIGDMPHNWASAECIRYLRHMLVMEDEKDLRLFDGLGLPEVSSGKPISLTYTPTKWGRITVTLEPVDKKNWHTKFVREAFDESTMPPIGYVTMPNKLPGEFWFDKITGAKRIQYGDRIMIPGAATTWECTWRAL